MSNPVVLITGALTGIGRATALAFAREGAAAVADVFDEANQATTAAIEEVGGRALAIRCDVTRGEAVKVALNGVVETFGRLDVAFNNAGVEQKPKPAADISEETVGLTRAGLAALRLPHVEIYAVGSRQRAILACRATRDDEWAGGRIPTTTHLG
jgi:NAD(P)-dependent dehydrogenase (short-subunit alcohol dehydrogenase family)